MTLAQIGALTGNQSAVPMLAAPPPLIHYLVENPWPVAIALLLAGIITLFIMHRRARLKDGLRALAAAALLAIAVLTASSLITTEREVLAERTRQAATLTAAASVTDLRDFLTERAVVKAFGPIPMPRGRDDLLDIVSKYLGSTYRLKDVTIGPVRAVVDGPNLARTQVRVWAKPEGEQALYNVATGAWFRLGWTREGAGPWRITDINVMQIDGVGVNPNPND